MRNSPQIFRCDQFSDEWKNCRIGIPTASKFHKILTAGGKRSEQRKPYMARLVAERRLNEYLPERVDGEPGTYWTSRGIDMEPVALQAFTDHTGLELDRVGFVLRPDGKLGCSPDALIVGRNEAVEVKSPAPWTHMEYLLGNHKEPDGDIWKTYRPQVQGQLLIGQWDCVHFYSYHPRMPAKYVITEPEQGYIATLRDALEAFLDELETETERARNMGPFVRAEDILNLRDE